MNYEHILAQEEEGIGIITLNRPDVMNALNCLLMEELVQQLRHYDADKDIGAIIIIGNERAFAAGADIKEMKERDFINAYLHDFVGEWGSIRKIRKPIIAAVSGYALGGGCELAMMCDFIIAADNAKFGQSEINLGIMPGIGGTQRLVRSIGKSKAMDMCLTGRMMDAQEAERCGLVSRVVGGEQLLDEALETAKKIHTLSQPAVLSIKECVNTAFETSLEEGLRFEKRSFYSLFSTVDKKEGMEAFLEKREPNFSNK